MSADYKLQSFYLTNINFFCMNGFSITYNLPVYVCIDYNVDRFMEFQNFGSKG